MAKIERKTISRVIKLAAAIPAGIPPVLRGAWGFAKRMAKRFSQQLSNPEKHEAEFLERVRKVW